MKCISYKIISTAIILIFIIIQSVFSESVSTGQSFSSDTTIADKFLNKAYHLKGQARYDSSNIYFEKAAEIYQNADNWVKYLRAQNGIGRNLFDAGAYEAARKCLNQSIEISRKYLGNNHYTLSNAYAILGLILWRTAQYENALEYNKKALEIRKRIEGEESPGIAMIYNLIGIIHAIKGNYDNALAYFEKCLAIKLKFNDEKNSDIASLYNNIGAVYSDMSDYDNALKYHKISLTIRKKVLTKIHPDIAVSLNNIGIIFEKKGKYEEALPYLKQAVKIRSEVLGPDHPDIATNYNVIGNIYKNIEKFDLALLNYEKALEIIEKKFGPDHPEIAVYYINLSSLFILQKKYEKAYTYLNDAITILIDNVGMHHPDVINGYHKMAELYQNQKMWDQALYYYQKSIIANIPGFNHSDPYDDPPLAEVRSKYHLLKSFRAKADVFANRYAHNNFNIKDLKTSYTNYFLAMDLIDQMRRGYKVEESKLFLAEQTSDIYDQAIRVAQKLFENTQNNIYKKAIYQITERSKYNILLDAITESEAKNFAEISQNILQKGRQLKIDLTFYEKKMIEELEKGEDTDSTKLTFWQDKVFHLKNAYDKHIQRLEKEYPGYFKLKYQYQSVSIGALQNLLDAHTALIDYHVGKEYIDIIIVLKNRFEVISVHKESDFDGLIQTFYDKVKRVDLIKKKYRNQYIRSAHKLFKQLVYPIQDQLQDISRLIIIPDSRLYYVPFEALITNDNHRAFEKLDYLIYDYEISYHYSATLLVDRLNKADINKNSALIGFAPVFADSAETGYILANHRSVFDSTFRGLLSNNIFLPLKSSEAELSKIANLYKNEGHSVLAYFHNEAREAKFKSAVEDYQYIHIATHGFINEDMPKYSGLAFAQPEEPDSLDDGILFAGETYNLNLNADLVTLSACESGYGRLAKGEGVMAMTRGFLYSGAANIVFSLWRVSDEATRTLMVEFYRQILAGKSYAAALRAAKLKLIREKEHGALPGIWSAFLLIGS